MDGVSPSRPKRTCKLLAVGGRNFAGPANCRKGPHVLSPEWFLDRRASRCFGGCANSTHPEVRLENGREAGGQGRACAEPGFAIGRGREWLPAADLGLESD